MLRKILVFLLILCLCLPACAEDAPSHLYHFASAAEAPQEIAADIADLFGADIAYVDGYATMRFGRWSYGQIILKDSQSYILCGLTYTGDETAGAWNIEYSRTALRPDVLPQLMPEAVEYGYDDYQVSQFDGCNQFKIVYDDLTYHWFAGSNGWMMHMISSPDYRLDVTQRAITRRMADGRNYVAQYSAVFNVRSPYLVNFDIASFPTTWEAAKALSDASEHADNTQAVTVCTPWDEEHFGWDVGVPYIRAYASPSKDSKCIAQFFPNVSVEILDHQDYSTENYVNDWYLVSILDFTAWVRRENLLIGSERAASWYGKGDPAMVYGTANQKEQGVYRSANAASPSAYLPVDTYVNINLITDDGFYLATTTDNVLVWMAPDTLCMTENLYDGYIYSEDPARRLNLRKGPGTQYESVGKYYSGTHVVFMHSTQAKTGWSRVIIEGVSGWVDSTYLKTYVDYCGEEWLPPLGKVKGVNEKGLNLRAAPSKSADVIAAYPVGTSVEILGIYDTIWAHVRLRDGNTGYMMLQYIGGEPEKAARNSFAVTRDITTTDGYGKPICTIKKGTRIRVAERPVDGQTEKMWIKTDDAHGYIPFDAADFW